MAPPCCHADVALRLFGVLEAGLQPLMQRVAAVRAAANRPAYLWAMHSGEAPDLAACLKHMKVRSLASSRGLALCLVTA